MIVGIDELDRIGTGSTEAEHDFELSCIGLRSVFDSSFDEVARVDYLDFQHAREILRRYVLDLSGQFHALAYVFSGGLARQLVRTARSIVELAVDQPGRDITDVVRALVAAELARARQATADALDRRGRPGRRHRFPG